MAKKITFSDKQQFVDIPNVPAQQKFTFDDVNKLKQAINENYERLTLDWNTDVADGDVIPVGRVIAASGQLLRCTEEFDVGTPKVFNSNFFEDVGSGYVKYNEVGTRVNLLDSGPGPGGQISISAVERERVNYYINSVIAENITFSASGTNLKRLDIFFKQTGARVHDLTAFLKVFCRDAGHMFSFDQNTLLLTIEATTETPVCLSFFQLDHSGSGWYLDVLVYEGETEGSTYQNTYASVPAMIIGQGDQDAGAVQFVSDASKDFPSAGQGDPTVLTAGSWAEYVYLGTTNGDLTDYRKRAEQESLDVEGVGSGHSIGLGPRTFETETTAPPTANCARLNNATHESATKLFLSNTDTDGADRSSAINELESNSIIRLIKDQDNFLVFKCTGKTAETGYFDIDLTYLEKKGDIQDNDEVSVGIDLRVDLSGKVDKVAGATVGNLAGLDANGNLTDSGVDPDTKADKTTTETRKHKTVTPASGDVPIDCESLETIIATVDTVMSTNHSFSKSNDGNLKHCFIDGECTGTVVLDFSAFSGIVCAEASGNLWTWDNTNKEITFDAATATPFEASIKKAKTWWILRFSAITPV